MKFVLTILLGLVLSSCMHWGMMESGGGHHAGWMHARTATTVLEKEVITGDLHSIAVFPGLEYGREATMTLRLLDAMSSTPISGARVYFEAQKINSTESDDYDGSVYRGRQLVEESHVPGVYAIQYTTIQRGEYRLVFYVDALGERELSPGIVVETTRGVTSDRGDHHGGMMDGTGAAPALILGAVGMGVMMIAVHAVGGSMF